MKCRIADFSMSMSGKQRVTLEIDGDFRKQFDKWNDKDLEVTIKKWSQKRSLTANAYAWLLIDRIAEKRRMSKIEVYRNAIRDIGGVSNFVCVKNIAVDDLIKTWTNQGIGWQVEELDCTMPGWTNLMLIKGSSEYSAAQMAALIDSLVQDAHALGIETRPQEEIDSLLEEYEKRC